MRNEQLHKRSRNLLDSDHGLPLDWELFCRWRQLELINNRMGALNHLQTSVCQIQWSA
jgi:hypothetical protein